jgi:uncharacterized protein YcbK (DUF882 family)
MITARHFRESEFRRCNPPCSLQDMRQDFMDTLDRVREKAGIPLVLNSAYRSKAWELSKGRTGDGAHTLGVAVDIRANNNANKYKIIKAALECGVTRIGVYAWGVHIDIGDRYGKTPQVVWYG